MQQLPRFNARPEVRSQLLASFINSFLRPAQLLKTNKSLIETLPDLVGGSPLLDKAVISLSSAFVAKNNRDDRLLQYSTKLYSQAMKILHSKIMMGKGLGKDLLYTTIIFQVYELINCSPSGFPAWLAHVQGSNALIRQCDGRSKEAVAENLFSVSSDLSFCAMRSGNDKQHGAITSRLGLVSPRETKTHLHLNPSIYSSTY